MFIDVVRPENWEELNDEVKSFLNLPEKSRARVYHGLSQGVFEISQGTAQFMSHKKSVAFITGQSPIVESLLPYYYKETYEVQKLSQSEMTDPKAWVESLKKDTCFVLFSDDHPVTGELYPFADELDKLLNEKRIFSFRLSHGTHFFGNAELRPYTVRFCSFGPQVCVAACGDRYRTPSLMAHTMEWDRKRILDQLSKMKSQRKENQSLVQAFERSLSVEGRPYFSAQASRTWDRAVCVFPDVSADALAIKIFEKLQISPEDGWQQIATTNMCSWDVVKMFGPWWEPKPKTEDLRGLLIVGVAMLENPGFQTALQASLKEIKEQQSWNV
ncbi:hypothetical protein AZI86_02540 [Bdellovibrio bacteriovorus]|uniref:Uncharacterized protein n=1 Tax=Bdellovibrio bacteriovorus TaxID=959 RepID=A0A150WP52_BDEBC|nr:hypothetical protein [Bdellovibrio bacteriovorus]KYG65965.1 hypothetical protein AZI86_02540 [Bdellovibrio bacteriovorus]